jgi:hypothetical protein
MAIPMTVDPALEALAADGPAPEHAEELMLYGRFVGSWEFDWTGFDADGNELLTTQGEWIFTWVLQGRAVQDVWICPSRALRALPDAPQPGEYGTTIRFYDPALGAWRVTWHGPGYGNLRTFVASEQDGRIVQEGATPDGKPLQWIFHDIAADSFSWTSQLLGEGGWRVQEQMAVRRLS